MVESERRPEREAGYNLVFLVMLFGLLSVMATAALPALKTQIQREKEAELIFRGLQIAEGIRVFQQRFGRYPNTLDELIEVEPRSMRQLWKDPMTPDGKWAFVLASGTQTNPDGTPQTEGAGGQELSGASGLTPPSSVSLFESDSGQQRPGGPILGVVSRKKGSALRTFLGKQRYEEWRFTANILPKPQVLPGSDVVVGASVAHLGKPFPRGLQPVGQVGDSTELTPGSGLTDSFAEDSVEDPEDDG